MSEINTIRPRFRIEDYNYIFSTESISTENEIYVITSTSTGHTIVIDEPIECGGRNRGPNPIELFLASIASCFIISLKLYARKYRIPIERVKVFNECSFDIRGFINPEEYESGIKKLTMTIFIESKASCKTIEELVNRTLKGWIVGSTIMKSLSIAIDYNVSCIENSENRVLSKSIIIKGV